MTNADLTLTVEENANPDDTAFVLKSLQDYNRAQAGDNGYRPLFIAARDLDGNIIGGLLADTNRDWLHIDILWVAEAHRGQGCGTLLVTAAEDEARQRGSVGAYLETFSFQAPEFYRKLGYTLLGQIDGFQPGGTQYYFTKRLNSRVVPAISPEG